MAIYMPGQQVGPLAGLGPQAPAPVVPPKPTAAPAPVPVNPWANFNPFVGSVQANNLNAGPGLDPVTTHASPGSPNTNYLQPGAVADVAKRYGGDVNTGGQPDFASGGMSAPAQTLDFGDGNQVDPWEIIRREMAGQSPQQVQQAFQQAYVPSFASAPGAASANNAAFSEPVAGAQFAGSTNPFAPTSATPAYQPYVGQTFNPGAVEAQRATQGLNTNPGGNSPALIQLLDLLKGGGAKGEQLLSGLLNGGM